MIRQDFAVSLLLAAGVVASIAQEANPIHWKAAGTSYQTKPGALLQVPVVAAIDEGWHLYSLKKLEGGPIPTTISIAAGQPFRLDGKIDSPEPIPTDDPNFGMTVEYFLQSARFVLPVRVAADALPGKQVLKITARYQTCNEKICLPPKIATMEVPVTVTK